MGRAFTKYLLLMLAGVIAACATQTQPLRVNVDGITGSVPTEGRAYVLLPGDKDTGVEDLQFQEFSAQIHSALASRGFTHAAGFDDAAFAIFLAYGVGDPQTHHYTYSIPVWGQTGISSATTQGTLTNFGSYGTFSATTTYTPTYGIAAYTAHAGEYVTYSRFFVLDAYDLARYRREGKLVPVWRTIVASTGASNDLRHLFPALVAASRPYLGSNTGGRLQVELPASDPAMQGLKGEQRGGSKWF